MKSKQIILLLFSLLLLLFLAACRSDKPAAPTGDAAQGSAATPTTEVFLPPADKAATPADAAQNFYAWYLDAIQETLAGNRDNPLANGDVVRSGYLTPQLMQRVNKLVLKFDEEGFVGLDPLWCAGGTPPDNFYLDGQFNNNGTPMILMRTNLPAHAFILYLQQTGNIWQISDIACTGTPEGVVNAFYLWYLSRQAQTDGAALGDGEYRASGFLSEALIEQVDAWVAAGSTGDDPFLLSASLPLGFSAVPVENSGSAVLLRQTFADASQSLRINLAQQGGYWKIESIKLATD
ncbi:MAG: hypothetical protein Fur0021_04880 [Candidatus Promineifilaceae bacterium]